MSKWDVLFVKNKTKWFLTHVRVVGFKMIDIYGFLFFGLNRWKLKEISQTRSRLHIRE